MPLAAYVTGMIGKILPVIAYEAEFLLNVN